MITVIEKNVSQRGPSIKHADRRPRLTRDIASAKYKGALTMAQGMSDMRLRLIALKHFHGGGPIITIATIAGPDGIINDIIYILSFGKQGFPMYFHISIK